ncbi:hypothetical protein FOT98_16695 [Bacillus sp. HY001]|nr:hypothetical protein FOT98_16695 [Bacillus sp. HY001]
MGFKLTFFFYTTKYKQAAFKDWLPPFERSLFYLNFIYPALMGSKTPTSKCSESKEFKWGITCPLKSDWFN